MLNLVETLSVGCLLSVVRRKKESACLFLSNDKILYKDHSGIFPCLLFGAGRCLLRSMRNALINWGRVSLGLITVSTSMLDAAW